MLQFHLTAILIFSSLWWRKLTAAAPLDSCWLQAVTEDCLNHKPSSISARFFAIPLRISLISCSYIQPPCWLTVKDYFLLNLYPSTTYFNMQRCSKDHHIELKLGDMIFCWQKHCRSHLWWHVIIGCSHFGGLKNKSL